MVIYRQGPRLNVRATNGRRTLGFVARLRPATALRRERVLDRLLRSHLPSSGQRRLERRVAEPLAHYGQVPLTESTVDGGQGRADRLEQRLGRACQTRGPPPRAAPRRH